MDDIKEKVIFQFMIFFNINKLIDNNYNINSISILNEVNKMNLK